MPGESSHMQTPAGTQPGLLIVEVVVDHLVVEGGYPLHHPIPQ